MVVGSGIVSSLARKRLRPSHSFIKFVSSSSETVFVLLLFLRTANAFGVLVSGSVSGAGGDINPPRLLLHIHSQAFRPTSARLVITVLVIDVSALHDR